ncbi:MAG TPA: endonuclease domain-containing protein [Xanthomonadales bacterium]|nr:endonuclease domain-containing protein [Xanthomonadales bacterium]
MKEWSGDPRAARVFHFGARHYDPATGLASLGYRLDNGPPLVEKLVFPYAPWPPETSRQAAFERALEVLHLVAGISYYKAALPPQIIFDWVPAVDPLLAFTQRLYIEGLAEFSHVNSVRVADRLHFPPGSDARPAAGRLLLPERALVAMGGGKDSLVGLNLMRRSGVEVMPVCVGASGLISDTVKAAGLPLLRISRQLAPELPAINAAGAWNGHIPVTAINSAILVCAAVLYGFKYVVFSNERSADEATLVTSDGVVVNHQYSKTSAFEREFRDLVHSIISPDIDYFSILRPFSELDIVRRFCAMSSFHPVYSSCNRNFHLAGPAIEGRWCGSCPKCRFAALSLALFLSPREVRAIQGKDLLDDPAQLEGFRALCGIGQDKPFECVGEAGESRAALSALAGRAEWHGHAVVQALAPEVRDMQVPSLDELLKPSAAHFIPAAITAALPHEFG